jgi:hypothetical protein
MILRSKFDIRDSAIFDDDATIRGRIVAICWSRDELPSYEVASIHEARAEYVYFDEWRLSR